MMKIKKLSAVLLAGALFFSMPAAAVTAEEAVAVSEVTYDMTSALEEAADVLLDGVDTLMSDPEMVVDLIMYVNDLVGRQDISDEEIRNAIDVAAEHFQISLSDKEKETLFKIAKKAKDLDLDEEQVREQVNKVFGTLDKLGIDNNDVKNILEKVIDFIKGFFQ